MSMTADGELLQALRGLSPAKIERIISTMPAETIQPLLGLLGTGDSARMPDSPIEQAQELDEGYRVVPHIAYLSERLTAAASDVRRGVSRKLLVSMPPRHGKTEMISVYLPLWLLRRDHRLKVGIISHSPTLAAVWGRRIRRLVERHGPQLGLSIAPDAGAVSEWETPEGGGVISRSIGQALAGVGFNILIIDDPTRDFAAAHSAAARQSVWEWYTANATTRLEPPSLTVIVQTRWHADDLTGRILSPDHEGDPSEWEQIIIPALAGEGDVLGRAPGEPLLSPLVPDETPAQALERFARLRRDVGSYAWAALFQQTPVPEAGAIFDSGWWRYWTRDPARATDDGRVIYLSDDLLAGAQVVSSWDATFKATDSSDFVVGQRWARVGADRILLDQSRARRSFTETVDEMLRFTREGLAAGLAHQHLVEDKANGPAIIDTLRTKVAGLKPINPRGSKEARARAVTPEIESGNVRIPLPEEAGWVRTFLDEARAFPSGEHDDQIDAMTQALDHLRADSPAVVHLPGAGARRSPSTSPRRRAGASSFRSALGGR